MKSLDRAVAVMGRVLQLGAVLALLGLGFLIVDGVLRLSVEQASTIGILSLAYLLFYGIGSIVIGAAVHETNKQVPARSTDLDRSASGEPPKEYNHQPREYCPYISDELGHYACLLPPGHEGNHEGTEIGCNDDWCEHLLNPTERAALAYFRRTNPDATAQSARLAAMFVPPVKERTGLGDLERRWLIRVGVGLVIGLIALANQGR